MRHRKILSPTCLIILEHKGRSSWRGVRLNPLFNFINLDILCRLSLVFMTDNFLKNLLARFRFGEILTYNGAYGHFSTNPVDPEG